MYGMRCSVYWDGFTLLLGMRYVVCREKVSTHTRNEVFWVFRWVHTSLGKEVWCVYGIVLHTCRECRVCSWYGNGFLCEQVRGFNWVTHTDNHN